MTARRAGVTVCEREFRALDYITGDENMVTCRQCLKRLGKKPLETPESRKYQVEDPESLNQFIAGRIALYRKKLGWSQDKLGAAANMTRIRVSLLERGKIQIGIADLRLFSRIFRKSLSSFLPKNSGCN